MQELIIKTRTNYFSFRLREESDVYAKSVFMDKDEKMRIRYSPCQYEINRQHNIKNVSIELLPRLTKGLPDEKILIIYTDDYDLKTKLTNWDFLNNFELTQGINFSWEFDTDNYNTFEGYQDNIRRNIKYKTILINTSELIEASLNGVSLI